MSFWDDDGWGGTRNKVNQYLWAMLLAVLKEVGETTAKELAAGLQEYLKENRTPDGWTREEFLTYAIGRLQLIKRQQIGPYFVDRMLDLAAARLIDHLDGKLADLNVDQPDPYEVEDGDGYGRLYDVVFDSTPDPALYVVGDKLYEAKIVDPLGVVTKKYRVLKGVVGYPDEVMVGYRDENGTWTIY